MNFTVRNDAFQCRNCGAHIGPQDGSCRNHCTQCLHSLHVDAEFPGDRASNCKALMAPIGVQQSGKKGWIVLHACTKCGQTIPNKLAPDDNMELVIELAKRPLESKPTKRKPR